MGWGCHAEEVADSDKESPTPGADALEHESGSDFFTMPALIDRVGNRFHSILALIDSEHELIYPSSFLFPRSSTFPAS